jgi:spermidine synthase
VSKRPSTIQRKSVEATAVQVEVESTEASAGSRDILPWLLLLLAGSGCAALIYEIVWFQLLQLVIGSSAVSLGLLLAAYMGGLCPGSAAFPRLVSARQNPLRVYALLELGIGAFGVIALFGVPLVGRIYVATAVSGLLGMVLRGLVAAACLLPPTLLMGCSYPAIARWVEKPTRTIPGLSSWLGLLYGANIAGAVIGCGLAGFYLLRVHDMAVATWAAAAINGAVALLGFALAARTRNGRTEPAARRVVSDIVASNIKARRTPGTMLVYVAIAFSGMTALGAEVVWTRLLSLLLGPTVYTFSIILGVFLVGLCAGTSLGSSIARRVRDPRLSLAACQILLAAAIAWTLAYVLPWWPVDPQLSISPWFNFDLDIIRCVRAIFPATLLWGASFPLALAGAAADREDPARLSGEVYAANTAGSIVGALAFSLLLIPSLGTQGSQRLLIWLAAAGAAVAIAPVLLMRGDAPQSGRSSVTMAPALATSATMRFGAALACACVLAWALASTVSSMPWQAIAYGRRIGPILRNLAEAGGTQATPLFIREGLNSSVVITQLGDQRSFYVSGKSEASSAPIDMRLQRLMGHVPALLYSTPVRPAPRSVLVVGFGAGVTAGSLVPYPEVGSIVICELEPLIPPASDEYFAKENYHVLHDPRTRMVYDDARHYILTTPERFDVITTDPIHPWVKGTSTLYSKEYFDLVRSHLNPGGVAAQWLPVYESDEETVKTQLATFFSVFPNATVWSNYLNGTGYDLVLLSGADSNSVQAAPINVDELQRRLSQPGYSEVAASLAGADTGFHSSVDLMATYAGRATDLATLLAGAQINGDLNMRLQYMAGLGLNATISSRMYKEILSYRRFPEGLWAGSDSTMDALRELMGRRPRTF